MFSNKTVDLMQEASNSKTQWGPNIFWKLAQSGGSTLLLVGKKSSCRKKSEDFFIWSQTSQFLLRPECGASAAECSDAVQFNKLLLHTCKIKLQFKKQSK